MRLDVVGVAVEAVLVVGHDDLGALLVDDLGEPLRRLVDRRRPEGLGVVVLGPALHARVPVAQSHQAVDAEDRHGLVELDGAHLRDLVAVVVIGVGLGAVQGVTALAVGARHQYGAHALVREQTVQPTRRTRFVVGVGVYGEKGQLPSKSSKEIGRVAGRVVSAPGALVVLGAKEQREQVVVHRDEVLVVDL